KSSSAAWNQFELGVTEMEAGRLPKAEEYFHWSEEIMGALRTSTTAESHAAVTSFMRAYIAYQRQDLAASEKLLRDGLAYYERTAPGGYGSMTAGADLGRILMEQGRAREAEDRIRRCLLLRQRYSPASQDTAQSHHDLGMLYWKTGRLTEARDELRQAVEDLESQQEKLEASDESMSIFRGRHREIYKDYIDLLMKLGREQDAFLI